eukprot:5164258-Prorocentrum_lima.AAC.1
MGRQEICSRMSGQAVMTRRSNGTTSKRRLSTMRRLCTGLRGSFWKKAGRTPIVENLEFEPEDGGE